MRESASLFRRYNLQKQKNNQLKNNQLKVR